MLQKLLIILLTFFVNVQILLAATGDLKDNILPTSSTDGNVGVLSGLSTNQNILDAILAYIRESIFGLMAMIAIGVFLYIWFKLISARGNPEEFKKALNTLIYAVIGIFVVSFAWAAVRLVAGLNI